MATDDTPHIDRVILWMVSGLRGQDLRDACLGRLGVEADQIDGLIAAARKRLTLAADYNRDEMLGTALTRLNDLYGRCVRANDQAAFAKALSIQREINRLAGLYATDGGGSDGRSDADGAVAVARDELEAVAGHLLPLGLAPAEYPLSEHARLAAERIIENGTGEDHG